MPALTRRRVSGTDLESWRVFYGDVQVGTIGMRSGVPVGVDQWNWACGFYPASDRVRSERGIAADFFTARAAFEAAWRRLLPTLKESDFQEYRREHAWTAWRYAMWDAGYRMPTQTPSGRSRCFCGAEINTAGASEHVYAAHVETA
jgi:hypothetical protein